MNVVHGVNREAFIEALRSAVRSTPKVYLRDRDLGVFGAQYVIRNEDYSSWSNDPPLFGPALRVKIPTDGESHGDIYWQLTFPWFQCLFVLLPLAMFLSFRDYTLTSLAFGAVFVGFFAIIAIGLYTHNKTKVMAVFDAAIDSQSEIQPARDEAEPTATDVN